ncbi:hypothetical protein A9Q81_24720, partial [Gammaproteobacteria bacterium 42_54_T18]
MKRITLDFARCLLPAIVTLSLTGCFSDSDQKEDETITPPETPTVPTVPTVPTIPTVPTAPTTPTNPQPPSSETFSISGAAVKGPLAFALVNVYELDASKIDFKGELVTSSRTSAKAKLEGLELQSPLSENYLVEVIADDTTIDLTTGKTPVITQLVSFISKQQIEENEAIFATPLSTIAIKVATNETGTATFEEKIIKAVSLTKSTLGFGVSSELNLFTDAPLLLDSQTSLEEQQQVIIHRGAIEAAASIMTDIANNNSLTTDEVVELLSQDLADGIIDAKINQSDITQYNADVLTLFKVNPDDIVIAGDDEQRTLADIKELLISETVVTGNSEVELDAFIEDTTETTYTPATLIADNDGDGIDNNADTDDDNDGVADSDDAFPLDDSESVDTDGDGTGNNADTDDDNDGVSDSDDAFPLDSTESVDTDGDTSGGDTGGGDTGIELSINGDFETGDSSGWTSYASDNNGTFAVTDAEANGGSFSGNLVADGAGSFPLIKQANLGIGEVTPNSEITISFDLFGSMEGVGGVVFAEFFSELEV